MFEHAPVNIWITQIVLFLCRGEVTKVEGQTWKHWEVSVIEVHDVKFPENQYECNVKQTNKQKGAVCVLVFLEKVKNGRDSYRV